MRNRPIWRNSLIITALFLICSCGGGGGGNNFAVDDDTIDSSIKYSSAKIQIGDTQEYLIGVLTEYGDSESLGIIGTINSSNEIDAVTKLLFIAEDGSTGIITTDPENGLPISMVADDGNYITFDNFSNGYVDVAIYNQSDQLLHGPEIIEFSESLVQDILSIYPFATISTASNLLQSKGLTPEQNSALLQFASVSANAVGCAASIIGTAGTSGLLLPLAVASCGSFLLSSAAAITDIQFIDDAAATVDATFCSLFIPGFSESSCVASFANGMSYTNDFSLRTVKYIHATSQEDSIQISWSFVKDAASYDLYYSTTNFPPRNWMKISNALTPYTLYGLEADKTYYFYAVAKTAAGTESQPSNEIAATPTTYGDQAIAIPLSYNQITFNDLSTILSSNGVPGTLDGKYVHRVEVQAGGGYYTHSEMKIHLAPVPLDGYAKGLSDDSLITRAQIGTNPNYTSSGALLSINGIGWADVSDYVNSNEIYMVLDSKWGSNIDTYIYFWFSTNSPVTQANYTLLDNYTDDFGYLTMTSYEIIDD